MSLTKFYAVPGLRIGAAYLHPALAERLQDTLIPWNVNGLGAVLHDGSSARHRLYQK